MSTKAIDSTVQKTHEWLECVRANMGGGATRDDAYNTLRAVLHAMRDRLTVDVAAHLGAQLPMLVRGLYYEGWHPAGKPLPLRHAEELYALVERELSPEVIDIEGAIWAAFRALEQHIDPGTIDKLLNSMPKELRGVWRLPPDVE